jgi:uncharacterized membrane protein YoaK (UPF0700 family)
MLTLVSGFVDAISYLGLGQVFTANMTGNVVVIGFALAGAPGFSIERSLASLAAFLAGSVCAGRAELRFRERFPSEWLRGALAAEAALQALASVLAFALAADLLLIAVLAFAMGMRNATVRRLRVPDMTTTVLTQTLTGLASDSTLAGGDNPRAARRVASVAAMLLGAFVGAVLVRAQGVGWGLLACALMVTATAATYPLRLSARPRRRTG